MEKITILDCYTDEPAGLGVPPYLGTYPRYLAGYYISEGYKVIPKKTLLSYLLKYNNDFTPPLSEFNRLSQYASKLYEFAFMLVAYMGGEITGICLYYDNDTMGKTAFLSMIHVQRDQRGNRLASELMHRMIANLRTKSFLSLSLEVSQENLNARAFYKSLGFQAEILLTNPINMKLAL